MFEDVRRSAFLDDLTPADRRIGRLLLSLPVGIVAAMLAAVIGGVFVMALFTGLLDGGFDQAVALFKSLTNPSAAGLDLITLLFVLCLLTATNGGMAVALAYPRSPGLETRRRPAIDLSRLGPYFRSIDSTLPGVSPGASATDQPAM